MATKFQQILIDHEFCVAGYTAEDWARHVEDELNNAGLMVVAVYASGPPEDELKPGGRIVEWSNASDDGRS